MYKIMKKFTISCSHRLHDKNLSDEENREIFGKCNNKPSHGHNYVIEVHLRSNILTNGMLMNFNVIKKHFNRDIDSLLDHNFLNNIMHNIPSAENMAEFIYIKLKESIKELYMIRVWETDTSYAEFTQDE